MERHTVEADELKGRSNVPDGPNHVSTLACILINGKARSQLTAWEKLCHRTEGPLWGCKDALACLILSLSLDAADLDGANSRLCRDCLVQFRRTPAGPWKPGAWLTNRRAIVKRSLTPKLCPALRCLSDGPRFLRGWAEVLAKELAQKKERPCSFRVGLSPVSFHLPPLLPPFLIDDNPLRRGPRCWRESCSCSNSFTQQQPGLASSLPPPNSSSLDLRPVNRLTVRIDEDCKAQPTRVTD
ncbi:hypothetical protein VTI74DRAFT_4599 [Chaetomium olivicolor]